MVDTSLAPGLLLAAPQLGDPNFERTVVVLARHGVDGALGWVINGRALAPVRDLLESSKLVPPGIHLPPRNPWQRPARVGGPVSPATGWLVYRKGPKALPGEISVGDELAVTGDADALRQAVRDDDLGDFRLLIGYAGWAPGQLEAEVRAGAWLPADVSPELVFDTHTRDVWDAAYQRTIGGAPWSFLGPRGGNA
jgi:putative transcriptional regulator